MSITGYDKMKNLEGFLICEVAVCIFPNHLQWLYQISTCLEVERQVQRLISQIWKHEMVALKVIICSCSIWISVVEDCSIKGSQNSSAVTC